MKKTPYLDILTSLLPPDQKESFLQSYSQPPRNVGAKNITIIKHKIDDNDTNVLPEHLNAKHFLHQWGFFYIQETAASLPASQIHTQPNDIILDMCAAPWGKTIQIADKWWFVIANEPSDTRRKALIYNINRCGCFNTTITNYDGTKIGNLAPNIFDKVLIDAPCSGEGMNYKIAIQQSRDERKIKNIAATQYQLLKSWIQACKPGWTIVYSTCTLNPIENELNIAHILHEFKDQITLENIDLADKSSGLTHWQGQEILSPENAAKVARFRPHIHNIWWFFIARFVKTWFITSPVETQNFASQTHTPHHRDEKSQQTITNKLMADFWIQTDEKKHFFIQTPNAIYLTSPLVQTPSLRGTKQSASPLHIQKTGIPIYEIGQRGNRIPTHHLGNILGHLATKNVIELTDDQAQDYADGKDMPVGTQNFASAFIILKRQTYGFSIGKIVDGKIKNKMI